jgi:hypothetical protein
MNCSQRYLPISPNSVSSNPNNNKGCSESGSIEPVRLHPLIATRLRNPILSYPNQSHWHCRRGRRIEPLQIRRSFTSRSPNNSHPLRQSQAWPNPIMPTRISERVCPRALSNAGRPRFGPLMRGLKTAARSGPQARPGIKRRIRSPLNIHMGFIRGELDRPRGPRNRLESGFACSETLLRERVP